MTSRLRRALANAALAASSVVAGLALLEVAVRLAGVSPQRFANTARIRDGRGHLLLDCYPENPRQAFDVDLRDPAARERYRAAGVARVDAVAQRAPFAVEFRYNALGFRDAEWSGKRPGVRRVIVLGDSFTEGWGVREADTYPRVLERLLDAAEPGRWEVRNAGRRGADFPALFATFEETLAFQPDLLVYGMVLNDVDRSPEIEAHQQYLNDWILDQEHLSSRPLPHTHWRLLALVEDRLAAWRIDRASSAWYRDLYREPNRAGWERTQGRLRAMDGRLRAQGARLLVAAWPLLVGLDGRYPFQQEHDTVARFCAEAGIARHDLLPVLRARPNRDLVVHPADRHPSAEAHRLAAESLAPVVRSMLGVAAATQGKSHDAQSTMHIVAASMPMPAASRAGRSRSPRNAGSASAISGTPMRPSSPRTVPDKRSRPSAARSAARKRRSGSPRARRRRNRPTDATGTPRNRTKSIGLKASQSA
jgi:GDSL-like Lipase/Acylhydrolase family